MQQKTISNSFSVTPVYDGAPGTPGAPGDTIWQAQAFKLFSGDPGNDKPSVTTNISASTTDFGNNWSAVPPSNNPSGVSKIDYSEVSGWKSGDNITIPSPGDGKNNTATIRFTTYGANAVVEIKITASSEANYDFGAIGKLDEKVLQSATASQIKNDASLSTVKVSGTGTAIAQLTVAEPGEHFVQICYAKDSSSSSGNDNAVVQVLTAVTPESKIYSSVATVANGTVSGSWSNARPWQGATGSDGQSSVLYALEPSRDSLNFRSNAVGDFSPSSITVSCKVKKYVGNEIDVISNPAAAGLYIYYVKNGLPQSWQPGNSCTVNASEALAEQYTVTFVKFVLSTASSSTLVTEANTIVSVLLPVVCDGRRGSVGATGRMFYSMGEWNAGTRYEKTDEVIPMVHYDDGVYNESLGSYGHYWYLNADSAEGTGHEPGTVTNEWLQCDDFGVVITQGLFAQFAKLGSFIMSGDWMISCAGYIYIDGTKTYYGPSSRYSNKPAYLRFDPNYPDSDSGNQNFIPVYAVDGRLGKSYQNDAYIKGTVYASAGSFTGTIEANDGHIGGLQISNNSIRNTEGSLILNANGASVFSGLIKAKSIYNQLKEVGYSQSPYNIDLNDLYDTYAASSLPVVFVLPNASDCPNLTINFFQGYITRSPGQPYTLVKTQGNASINLRPTDAWNANYNYKPGTNKYVVAEASMISLRALGNEWWMFIADREFNTQQEIDDIINLFDSLAGS